MNQIICNLLDLYQNRIGSYDNHSAWEKPLDIVLKNNFYCLSNKKSNRIEDHIDIDLIKGSAFSKSKSKLSLPSVFLSGLQKLLFYPLFFKWWQYHINLVFAVTLLVVYLFQVANYCLYFFDSPSLVKNGKQVVNLAEIVTPTVIMFILCIMYTVITSALPSCNETSEKSGSTNSVNNYSSNVNEICKNQKPNRKANRRSSQNDEIEISRRKSHALNSDNFYKQVYLEENLFFTGDLADNFDLNEGDLSDSDQTDHNSLNDTSSQNSPARDQKKNESEETRALKRGSQVGFDSHKENISCIIWESNEWKGVDLSMSEISTYIQTAVRKNKFSLDYFYIGIVFSIIIALLPVCYYNYAPSNTKVTESQSGQINNESHILEGSLIDSLSVQLPVFDFLRLTFEQVHLKYINSFLTYTGTIDLKVMFVLSNTLVSTIILSFLLFSLLTVADRTLNQRFLHAKYFCYLTILRRAKKHNLPHFRLGKVENIKMWLSLRSFMKRNGPQRSIDVIISSTFLIGVGLCSIVCIRFLQDADFLSDCLLNWQLVLWCFCIWTYMLRFMTVGFKTNKKYRNCMSMVITEQINLYLQMEKMPERKEGLMVVNNVLKLASDLLKEIENPFKISGLGVNPWVYNITKVVILSAFSAVVSELLGFKLKLYKIKIN